MAKVEAPIKQEKLYAISQWLEKMPWLDVVLSWKQFKTMSLLSQKHSLNTARQEEENIFSHTEISTLYNTFKNTLVGRRLGLKVIH